MQQLEKLKSDPNEQFKDEIKEYKSFSFPVNLEKYFDICLCENKKKDQKQCECKKEFNPYDFFKKENESKKEELKKFLEKSKLNDFLDQKKRKVKKGEVKE